MQIHVCKGQSDNGKSNFVEAEAANELGKRLFEFGVNVDREDGQH